MKHQTKTHYLGIYVVLKTITIRKHLKIQTKIEYCTYLQIVGLFDINSILQQNSWVSKETIIIVYQKANVCNSNDKEMVWIIDFLCCSIICCYTLRNENK